MVKHTLSAVLTLLAVTALVNAQAPPLSSSPQTPSHEAAIGTAITSGTPASTRDTQMMPAPAVPAQTAAETLSMGAVTADCGCGTYDACSSCGSAHQQHLSLKEKCAYYRSVRQAFDRGPCCDQYFGGYGPLWDTYCMDKQRSCATECRPTSTCRSHSPRPHLGQLFQRRKSCCDSCGMAPASCDCAAGDELLHQSVEEPVDIGLPPEPTEADEPAGTAPAVEAPSPEAQDASASRGWPRLHLGWRANR